MNRIVVLALVVGVSCFGACAPNLFRADGYHHPQYPVHVASARRGVFVSHDWQVLTGTRYSPERVLMLDQRRTGGRMWVSTVALEDTEIRRSLSSLVDAALAGLERFGYVKIEGETTVRAVASNVQVQSVADTSLAGLPARAVMITDSGVLGTLVFARVDVLEQERERRRVVPLLIVAGLVERRADFEPAMRDFISLLGGITIEQASR